jgi:hypothetical protein
MADHQLMYDHSEGVIYKIPGDGGNFEVHHRLKQPWYSVPEAAKYWRVSPQAVLSSVKGGKLDGVHQVDGKHRILIRGDVVELGQRPLASGPVRGPCDARAGVFRSVVRCVVSGGCFGAGRGGASVEPGSADAPWADPWEGEADGARRAGGAAGVAGRAGAGAGLRGFAELDAAYVQASPAGSNRHSLPRLSDEQKAELVALYNQEQIDGWVMPRLEAIKAQTRSDAEQARYAVEADAQARVEGEQKANEILSGLLPRDVDPRGVLEIADQLYYEWVGQGYPESRELAVEALQRAARDASDAATWNAIWKRSVR